MKKLFLIVLASSFFAFNSNAQVQRDVTRSQKRMSSDSTRHIRKEKAAEDLNLTADQKTKVKDLRESGKQQREAIQNDASLTSDQRKAKMKELAKSQNEKMNNILTPDQQAKRKAYAQKMRGNRKMHGQKGGNRPNRNSATAPATNG